jgi:hypothetical protein
VARSVPAAAGQTFTLKEVVRLCEALPPAVDAAADTLVRRVAEADALRAGGFEGNPRDEDVADPLGQPQDTYRAVAWELDEWVHRLVDGMFGPRRAPASISGNEDRA